MRKGFKRTYVDIQLGHAAREAPVLKLEIDTSATGVFVPKSSVAEAPKHPRRRGRLMWPTKLIFTAAIAKSPRKPPTPPSRICISRHDSIELNRLQFGLHYSHSCFAFLSRSKDKDCKSYVRESTYVKDGWRWWVL